MLINFTLGNYLSFKEKIKLDLSAGAIKELQSNVHSRIAHFPDLKLLKSLALYGSNSSGKSNLLKGFSFVRSLVLNSSKESQANEPISVEPFRLNQLTEKDPCSFNLEFIIDNTRFSYGFATTTNRIISEYLFTINKNKKYETIFVRQGGGYEFNRTLRTTDLRVKIQMLSEVTRENALFLSVLAQFNVDVAKRISDWFHRSAVIFDSNILEVINYTASLLKNTDDKNRIKQILINSDLGITSIEAVSKGKTNKLNLDNQFLSTFFTDENFTVTTSHKKFNGEKHVDYAHFELLKNESLGTQKFFGLLGPIISALKKGSLLWIDELDSSFHTLMLEVILKLFNSPTNNPNGSQLIFTLHNTDPLKRTLRRDQMVLVEKDNFGSSTFFSLYEKLPKVRNDASFEKEYLMGKYGAVPKLNSQLDLFGNNINDA